MSDLLQYFKAEADRHRAKAQEILDKADAEGREVTPDEKAEAEGELDLFKTYTAKAAKRRDEEELRRQIETEPDAMGDSIERIGGTKEFGGVARTIGEAFVKTGLFKAIQARKQQGRLGEGWRTEAVELPYDGAKGLKAAAMPVLESGDPNVFGNGTTTSGIMRTLFPDVETPGFTFLRLTIADLLPSVPITVGNAAVYPKVVSRDALEDEITLTGSSWGIAEGGVKNPLGYEFDSVTEVLRKIAAYTKVSEELLEDAPAIAAYINADLPFQIRQAEEVYLSNKLYDGVADATSLDAGTTAFDEILAAKLAVEVAGGEPNGMIITPTDWAELLAAKFGTGAGDLGYVGGGPFSPTNNPWDLRIVITPNAVAEHPLIGDFTRGAKIYRKGGLSVQATNTDQDDFIRNLVTIRAEERLTLGITYPAFFKKADLS